MACLLCSVLIPFIPPLSTSPFLLRSLSPFLTQHQGGSVPLLSHGDQAGPTVLLHYAPSPLPVSHPHPRGHTLTNLLLHIPRSHRVPSANLFFHIARSHRVPPAHVILHIAHPHWVPPANLFFHIARSHTVVHRPASLSQQVSLSAEAQATGRARGGRRERGRRRSEWDTAQWPTTTSCHSKYNPSFLLCVSQLSPRFLCWRRSIYV